MKKYIGLYVDSDNQAIEKIKKLNMLGIDARIEASPKPRFGKLLVTFSCGAIMWHRIKYRMDHGFI